LAAQPLVRQSYLKPAQTHCTNVMGTVNVLEAARSLDKHCTVVCISTDKCYENQGWCFGYRECDSLGGYDPYSASKAAMEIIVRSYQQSFLPNHGNIRVATARAGNVIGGGDWAEDRIVPDCARAFLFGATLKVRNPDATRPWQHVLDPLSGYMLLASALSTDGSLCTAFNFGPQQDGCRSVTVLVNEMKQHLGGRWELDDAVTQPHEAQALSLSIDKATRVLGWRPTWGFSKAVEKTAEWYRAAHSGADVRELTISHINAFELDMAE
jgi:CDP-glucose 4,6-dehydratase